MKQQKPAQILILSTENQRDYSLSFNGIGSLSRTLIPFDCVPITP